MLWGRINNVPISELANFPYLLSPKHQITKLLVYTTHEKLHYAGVSSTITAICQLYWIPAIRVYVRKLLRICVTCLRLIGIQYRPPDPSPLPKVRIEQPQPHFQFVVLTLLELCMFGKERMRGRCTFTSLHVSLQEWYTSKWYWTLQ